MLPKLSTDADASLRLIAAESAEAAALHGKFWEMHDIIYERQNLLSPDILPIWAEEVGLELKQFGAHIRQGEVTKRIKDDRMGGIHSGVNGERQVFSSTEQGTTARRINNSLGAVLQQQLEGI